MTEKYAVVEDIRNSVDEIQKKVEHAFDRTKRIGKRLFYMKNQITYCLTG